MNKIYRTLFIIVPTAIMLTGCSHSTISDHDIPNERETEFIISEGMNNDIQSGQSTIVNNGKITYTNAGSSTCPPIIDKVSKTGDNEYTLTVKRYSKVKCTFDLSPIQQIIERSDGKPIPDESSIVLEQPSNKKAKKWIY